MNPEVLYVNMFGQFTLTYGGKKISCTSNRSRLTWNILAYLLCHRGELISAEELISAVWKQENDNPAGAMRTAVHRARAMLIDMMSDSAAKLLVAKSGGYMWNANVETVVDTDEFDRLVTVLQSGCEETDTYLAALNLYEGKFLPMQDSELWVMPIQAYYQTVYSWLLNQTIPKLEREGRYKEGIALCRKALLIDAYSESVYQHLMRFLLQEGDRQEVIRVYEDMSKLLLSTLGILPNQESRALYREAISTCTSRSVISPEDAIAQLCEEGNINGALICDYDFFRILYQAQARTIVRTGNVVHTVLMTLKPRTEKEVSEKSMSLAMDNLEKLMAQVLRKGDVITRCSASQFLLMLPSANYENSGMVCRRVVSAFERKYPHAPVCVDVYIQALSPSTQS